MRNKDIEPLGFSNKTLQRFAREWDRLVEGGGLSKIRMSKTQSGDEFIETRETGEELNLSDWGQVITENEMDSDVKGS